MAKQSAFSRLLEDLRAPSHDYRTSTEVFAEIDVERVAQDLSLEHLGTERGRRGEPPATGTLDEVENRIIERVEAEKKRSHGILEDELRVYEERLANLSFEGSLASIKEAALACVGDFRAEVAKGLNDLHYLRRRLTEHEQERAAFRKKHKLERAPRVHTAAVGFLKAGIIAVLLVVETAVNGIFLAKGNDLGVLGGTTEALAFAVLNVIVAYAIARLGVVQLFHRSFFRKLIGLLCLAAYLAFAAAINLALAHYREISGTLIDEAGREVLTRLIQTPFLLTDINSWVFVGIGLVCSATAFIDGLVWSDPYPGYGGVEKRLNAARDDYTGGMEGLIEELSEIRNGYRDQIKELIRVLGMRRGEYDSILAGRSRLIQLFDQHQIHLERTANSLLSIYRDANSRARDGGVPKRFAKPYTMDRFVPAVREPNEGRAELVRTIAASQELLETQAEIMHREFDVAVSNYRRLDDLVPEASYVAAA